MFGNTFKLCALALSTIAVTGLGARGAQAQCPLDLVGTLDPATGGCNDPAAGDRYGYTVAMDANHAVAGSRPPAGIGAVYVYERSGTQWFCQDVITPADVEAGDEFVSDVGIDGAFAVFGSEEDDDDAIDAGAAYVYREESSGWVQHAKLIASDAATGDLFGQFVAILGDYIVVAAAFDDDNGEDSGSVYVFVRNDNGTPGDLADDVWSQRAKLKPSDGAAFAYFGQKVAIDGNYIVVGAPGDNNAGGSSAGAAYVFLRDDNSTPGDPTDDMWSQQDKLTASNGSVLAQFGFGLDISGDRIVVGAPLGNGANFNDSGVAYVFLRNDNGTPGAPSDDTWPEETWLTFPGDAAFDYVGLAVAIEGNRVIVGAPADNAIGPNPDWSGGAWLATYKANQWLGWARIIAADASPGDTFAWAVDMSGDYAIFGALDADNPGVDSGKVYILGDVDGDGLLDEWETCSMDVNDDISIDLDLPALSADPLRKDIFLEVDYMTDHGLRSDSEADLIAAFDNAPVSNPSGVSGIALHIQVDDELTHAQVSDWNSFDTDKTSFFGTQFERSSSNAANILEAKRRVFRYCQMLHKWQTDGGDLVAGQAELGGNDLAVALGFNAFAANGAGHRVGNREQQAGVLMHELGHTLCLRHGGADDLIYKPNYESVLNYTWTVPGGGYDAHWILDFSRSALPTLYENKFLLCQQDYPNNPLQCPYTELDETVDLVQYGYLRGAVAHGPPKKPNTQSPRYTISAIDNQGQLYADWNQDGDTLDTSASANVNCLRIASSCTCNGDACTNCCGSGSYPRILVGHDDWSSICYFFRESGDFADFVHDTETGGDEISEQIVLGLRGGVSPCADYRDDDNTRESDATIDYNDDFLEKTIDLTTDPSTAGAARLWIYGQPYNYAGQDFQPRQDYRIRVNGDPAQLISFDVGAVFNYQIAIYQWVSFDVPANWLVLGLNQFYIFEQSPIGAWDHNNLRVGVDTDTDVDLSWWCGNGVIGCGDPILRDGELMIYLEICMPGDVDCDGAAGLTDIAAFVLALLDPAQYGIDFPGCDINGADFNGDGLVDGGDVSGFVQILVAG